MDSLEMYLYQFQSKVSFQNHPHARTHEFQPTGATERTPATESKRKFTLGVIYPNKRHRYLRRTGRFPRHFHEISNTRNFRFCLTECGEIIIKT